MEFSIPCATFVRLAKAAMQPDETDSKGRIFFRCVRLEHRHGMTLALATNGRILSIEKIGDTEQPDGTLCVTLNSELMKHVVAEAEFDSVLSLNYDPPSNYAIAMTTFGYMYPDNASILDEWPDWRLYLPTTPTKLAGTVVFNEDTVRLMGTAPNGMIALPKIVNSDHAIILRDPLDANWFGLIMSVDKLEGIQIPPATIPDFAL